MALYGPWQQPADPVAEFEGGYKFASDNRQRTLENRFRQQQLEAEQNRATAYQQLLEQERQRMALTQKAAADRAAADLQRQTEQDKVTPLPNNEGYTYGGRLYFNKPPAPDYPQEGSQVFDADQKAIPGIIYGPKGQIRNLPQTKPTGPKPGTVSAPFDEANPTMGRFNISMDDPLYQKWAAMEPTLTTNSPATPEIPNTRVPVPLIGGSIPIPFTGSEAKPADITTNNIPPSLGTFLKNPGAFPAGGTNEPSIGDTSTNVPPSPNAVPDAPPTAGQRQVGQRYVLPNGKIGIWRGQGWELAQ